MPIAIYASGSYKRESKFIVCGKAPASLKLLSSKAKGKMETEMKERRNENIVSIDTGKAQSYVVVEEHGKITKEGYTGTFKEGFAKFIEGMKNPTMIIETSSCFNICS